MGSIAGRERASDWYWTHKDDPTKIAHLVACFVLEFNRIHKYSLNSNL